MPLDKIVKATANQPDHADIFNNAGQAWNHNFYWRSMSRRRRGRRRVERLMEWSLGSVDVLELSKAAVGEFGSG